MICTAVTHTAMKPINTALPSPGVSYEHQLSEKTFTKFTLGYSTTMQLYDYDSISNIDGGVQQMFNEDFTTSKMSGVWSLMHKVNAKNNFQAGITYDQTFSRCTSAKCRVELHPKYM